MAKATGAPVYCPEIEVPVLADIMSYVPWPGFGPFESYDADHTVAGGEHLSLAGLEIDVLFTPGHSPGHVTYAIPDEGALFSGDVLFKGSVGRVDLPGGDWDTLLESIRGLVDGLPGGDGRLSRPHGGHDARRRAGDQSVPRRAGAVSRRRTVTKLAPGWPNDSRLRGAPSTCSPPTPPRASASRRRPRDLLERAGYARIETPTFEDTELFARGVGGSTDIVRKEMFTFEDQGGRSVTPSSREHRLDRPRLPRARHAEASAAGEALVVRVRSSGTSARRRAAFASSPSSTPRRSDPTRRSSTPS